MSANGGHPDDPDAHPGQGSRTDRSDLDILDVVLFGVVAPATLERVKIQRMDTGESSAK
jgi:hypothetical protein